MSPFTYMTKINSKKKKKKLGGLAAKKTNKTYVTLIIPTLAVCGKRLFQDDFFNERKVKGNF